MRRFSLLFSMLIVGLGGLGLARVASTQTQTPTPTPAGFTSGAGRAGRGDLSRKLCWLPWPILDGLGWRSRSLRRRFPFSMAAQDGE